MTDDDKLQKAKKILATGKKLKDQELIDIAMAMLEEIEIGVDKKLLEEEKSVQKEEPKKRGRKKKIITKTETEKIVPEVKLTQPELFTTAKANKDDDGPKFKYDEEGNVIGTFGRKRKVKPFTNSFKDNNTLALEDKAFTKQVKATVSPRREEAKPIKKNCINCNKEFEYFGFAEAELTCGKCSKNLKFNF